MVNIWLIYIIHYNPYINIWLVVESYPSDKNIKVSWDYDIPNIWQNKIHVPNHQPVYMYVWVLYGLKQPSFLSAAGLKPCAAAWA